MRLSRVGVINAVAPPSERNKQPRNVFRADAEHIGQTGVVESLELRGDWVVLDGTMAVPLSNVAFIDPAPAKRGRPLGSKPDPENDEE